jgi:hypothetical protein
VPEVDAGDIVLNKKEQLQFERLKRLLAAERERAERAWAGYREALYELVDAKMKLELIEKAINGNYD